MFKEDVEVVLQRVKEALRHVSSLMSLEEESWRVTVAGGLIDGHSSDL